MKIHKGFVAIGAALMVIGTSSPALAFDCGGTADNPDPATISDSLVALATYLRCPPGTDANPGTWPYEAIWQKRGTGSCEVQDSLARKLNEEREFSEGSKPPQNKNNAVAGASGDVDNGKFLAAVEKLDAFNKDAYKSRLNPDYENASLAKMFFVNEVEAARGCVCKLTECE